MEYQFLNETEQQESLESYDVEIVDTDQELELSQSERDTKWHAFADKLMVRMALKTMLGTVITTAKQFESLQQFREQLLQGEDVPYPKQATAPQLQFKSDAQLYECLSQAVQNNEQMFAQFCKVDEQIIQTLLRSDIHRKINQSQEQSKQPDIQHKYNHSKEQNYILQQQLAQMDEQSTQQIQALQKAQMVMEKLDQQHEQSQSVVHELTQQIEQLQVELADQVRQLEQARLQLVQTKEGKDQRETDLKIELQGLKQCMSEYHQEMDRTKQQHLSQLKSSQLSQVTMQDEVCRLRLIIEEGESVFKHDLEQKCLEVVDLEDEVQKVKRQLQQCHEEYSAELDNVRQTQKVWLRMGRQEMVQVNFEPSFSRSLLNEFQLLQQEVIQMRACVRESLLPQHQQGSLDFQQKALVMIDQWETKATQLKQLAEQYHGWLGQQQQLIGQLKGQLREKDKLIAMKTGLSKERSLVSGALVDDCGYREELMLQIGLLSRLLDKKERERIDAEMRLQEFKREYLHLLDQKDDLTMQLSESKSQYQNLDSELQLYLSDLKQCCQILSISPQDPIQYITQLVQDLRQEVNGQQIEIQLMGQHNQQLQQWQQQSEINNQLNMERVRNECDSQIQSFKMQCQQNEQAISLQLQESREQHARLTQQVQLRERQFAKLQIRIEELQLQADTHTQDYSRLINDRDSTQAQLSSLRSEHESVQQECRQLQDSLKLTKYTSQQSELDISTLSSQLASLQSSNRQLKEEQHKLQEQSRSQEYTLQLYKEQQAQNDIKLADMQLDYSCMYGQMKDAAEGKELADIEKQRLQRDVDQLLHELAQRDLQDKQYGTEIRLQMQEVDRCKQELAKTQRSAKSRVAQQNQICQVDTVSQLVSQLKYENQQLGQSLLQSQQEQMLLIEDKRELELWCEGSHRDAVMIEKDLYIQRLEQELADTTRVTLNYGTLQAGKYSSQSRGY